MYIGSARVLETVVCGTSTRNASLLIDFDRTLICWSKPGILHFDNCAVLVVHRLYVLQLAVALLQYPTAAGARSDWPLLLYLSYYIHTV